MGRPGPACANAAAVQEPERAGILVHALSCCGSSCARCCLKLRSPQLSTATPAMDRSRGSLAALLLLLCSGCAWRAQAQVVIEDAGTQGTYDPCKAPPRSVKKVRRRQQRATRLTAPSSPPLSPLLLRIAGRPLCLRHGVLARRHHLLLVRRPATATAPPAARCCSFARCTSVRQQPASSSTSSPVDPPPPPAFAGAAGAHRTIRRRGRRGSTPASQTAR